MPELRINTELSVSVYSEDQRDQHVAARNHCFDHNDPDDLITLILSLITLIPGLITMIPEERLRA